MELIVVSLKKGQSYAAVPLRILVRPINRFVRLKSGPVWS